MSLSSFSFFHLWRGILLFLFLFLFLCLCVFKWGVGGVGWRVGSYLLLFFCCGEGVSCFALCFFWGVFFFLFIFFLWRDVLFLALVYQGRCSWICISLVITLIEMRFRIWLNSYPSHLIWTCSRSEFSTKANNLDVYHKRNPLAMILLSSSQN